MENNFEKNWYCYFLISNDNRRTYIGVSNNIHKRLRKHNGELTGGAKATRSGRPWRHICSISGFTKINSLRFEWRVKRSLSKKNPNKLICTRGGPFYKMKNMFNVLNLERWTSKSDLAKNIPLVITWYEDKFRPQNLSLPKYISEVYSSKKIYTDNNNMENKKLFCIRHGRALHNDEFLKHGEKAYRNLINTPLVDVGINQAKDLNKNWEKLKEIDLVLVSPLKRTIQTANNIFENNDIPIIAIDSIQEFPLGFHRCNKRECKKDLINLYPNIDFSNLNENSDWSDDFEAEDNLIKRIDQMKDFLKTRKEKNIAIVSHNSFLSKFLFNEIRSEKNEIKHCYPYEIDFKK